MVLALMTIAAFTAVQSSTMEVKISGNQLLHQKYFFTAEAGIAHAVKTLGEEFITANTSSLAFGMAASWNFAFNGGDRLRGTADDAVDRDGDGLGSHPDGALWVEKTTLEGITYRVFLFNNDDTEVGGSYRDDRDEMVWVRCDATGPKGGGASVQVLLQGQAGGPVIVDYTAQAGAGAGENFISYDLNPITEFLRQL
jgi:hypothetical protein